MNKLSNILETIIAEKVGKEKKVAVLLSGGKDSLSIAFAAEVLGYKVCAYTFKLKEIRNKDAEYAEKASKIMGWKFHLTEVPTDNLIKDFLILSEKWKCNKKTSFECTFPMLYVVPNIKQKYVLSGIGADLLYGVEKRPMIHFRHTKEEFDGYRKSLYFQPNASSDVPLKKLMKHYKHKLIMPYLDIRVFNYFMQFDWNQLNKPKQKQKTIDAYPNQFEKTFKRIHESLQVAAGIREVFETLLETDLNINKRIRVMDLCRDYTKTKGQLVSPANLYRNLKK